MVKKVRVSRAWGKQIGGRQSQRSKYNVDLSDAGKVARTIDGITFASNAEADRYRVLRNRERAGIISGLQLQPCFELQEGFTDNQGHQQSAIGYTADFRYQEDGETVIEEVKGKVTRDFKLRMRLFLFKFPQYRYKLVPAGEVYTHS